MYVNWLCPVWMWIDPDFSSQLALPLAGLTPQHPWRTCCCWPAPPQHLKPLADASSPPALSVPLPSQQLSSSRQLGCGIPMTLVSDPWGCPARFAQHVFVCLCVSVSCLCVAILPRRPCSAASSILLVMQCHPLAEAPRNPPLQLFSATGDAPKMKY